MDTIHRAPAVADYHVRTDPMVDSVHDLHALRSYNPEAPGDSFLVGHAASWGASHLAGPL